jgi:(R,R)-butanediol dehydrogenase/meso-butanediol dehydrogenase/diacetyl reductase
VGADLVMNTLEVDAVEEIRSHIDEVGIDVAFEVAGIQPTIEMAIQATKPEGNVVNISIWEKPANINLNNLILAERKMTSIIAYRNNYKEVIQLIANGQIQALDLVTKRIALDNIVTEGFEALTESKNQIKILVDLSK